MSPAPRPPNIRVHRMTFPDGVAKARWLGHQAHLDSFLEPIATLAKDIARGARSDTEAIERVFRWVQERIAYVRDPGWREQFANPWIVARRGFDDCDGKARLLVALLTALKRDVPARHAIDAQIDAVFRGDVFDHVQAIARGADTRAHPRADRDGWLLLDPTLAGVRVGDGAEAAHIDPETKAVAVT